MVLILLVMEEVNMEELEEIMELIMVLMVVELETLIHRLVAEEVDIMLIVLEVME